MKRFTALFLLLVMLLPMCLTACKNETDTDPQTPADTCLHVITKVEAKTATCTEEGNTEHYKCEKCKKLYTDTTCATEIKDANSVKVPKAHKYGTDGLCEFCSEAIPEKLELLNSIFTAQTFAGAEATLTTTVDGQKMFTYIVIDLSDSIASVNDIEADLIMVADVEGMYEGIGMFVRNGRVYTTKTSFTSLGEDFVATFRAELAKTKPNGVECLGTIDELLAENGMDLSIMLPAESLPADFDIEIFNTAITQLCANLIENFFTEYEKTDSGYKLTFDFETMFEKLFDGVIKVAEAIDKDNQANTAANYSGMKVIDILKLPEARKILEPYFNKITATQIKQLLEEMNSQVPEGETGIPVIPTPESENAYDYILDILCTLGIIPDATIGELIGGEEGFTGNLNSVNFKNILQNAKAQALAELTKELNAFSLSFNFDINMKMTGMSVNLAVTDIEYELDPDTFEESDVEIGRTVTVVTGEATYLSEAPVLTDISGYTYTEVEVVNPVLNVRGYENFFYILDLNTYEEYDITFDASDFSYELYTDVCMFYINLNGETTVYVEYTDPTYLDCNIWAIYDWESEMSISPKGYGIEVTFNVSETADGDLYTFIGSVSPDAELYPDIETPFEFRFSFILSETVVTIE